MSVCCTCLLLMTKQPSYCGCFGQAWWLAPRCHPLSVWVAYKDQGTWFSIHVPLHSNFKVNITVQSLWIPHMQTFNPSTRRGLLSWEWLNRYGSLAHNWWLIHADIMSNNNAHYVSSNDTWVGYILNIHFGSLPIGQSILFACAWLFTQLFYSVHYEH